jgi:hypothetical protein
VLRQRCVTRCSLPILIVLEGTAPENKSGNCKCGGIVPTIRFKPEIAFGSCVFGWWIYRTVCEALNRIVTQ